MTLNNWIISWMFQTKSTCGMAQGKYQTASPCADGLNCWNCTIPFGKRSGCMNWFLWARNLADWCGILSLLARDLAAGALLISNPFGKDFWSPWLCMFQILLARIQLFRASSWRKVLTALCSESQALFTHPCLSLPALMGQAVRPLTRPPCKCQHCHQIDDLCYFWHTRQPFLLPQFWL